MHNSYDCIKFITFYLHTIIPFKLSFYIYLLKRQKEYMNKLSDRVNRLGYSQTFVMSNKAREMKATE